MNLAPTSSTVAYDPTSIAGLKCWFKADGDKWTDVAMTTPVTADGDSVAAMGDMSGNSIHMFRQCSLISGGVVDSTDPTSAPVYKVSIQNGKPGIYFDGVNDCLQSTATYTTQQFTQFIVFNMSRVEFLYIHDNLVDHYNFFQDDRALGNTMRIRTPALRSSYKNGVTGAWDGSPMLIRQRYAGTHATHTLAKNGVVQSLTEVETTNPSASIVGVIKIGSEFGHAFCAGYLFEFIEYDTALSAGNISYIEAGLTSKWGL